VGSEGSNRQLQPPGEGRPTGYVRPDQGSMDRSEVC